MEIDGPKDASNCSEIKCCFGKHCNRLCGFKMHQCSCRVIKDMSTEMVEVMEQSNFMDTRQDMDSVDWDSLPNIKPGINYLKATINGN